MLDTERVDIGSLIAEAESVTYDDQLGFAAEIQKPVNRFKDDSGNTYELKIVATLIKKSK